MKFLRAENQINVRQFINEFLAATLRHATEVAENLVGAFFARRASEIFHFVHRLLLGGVAHAASVQQHHVGQRLGLGERIAFGHELRGDGLAVALVHLAAVGFDENTGHDFRKQHTQGGGGCKVESF